MTQPHWGRLVEQQRIVAKVSRLRALERLNPALPPEAITSAVGWFS
jgi:hypothetical protein